MPEVQDPAPTPDAPPAPEESGKAFSQADVDRIVQERLARVKPPADYDDLKAKADKLAEIESANLSELEKANTRAEQAEANAKAATDRANAALRRAAVTSAASTAGAVDTDAVFALLDVDAVTIGDDGQVTGAVEAVTALLESKPYLVGQAQPAPKPQGSTDGGPRSGGTDGPRQLTRDDLTTMTPEQIVTADNNGQLADLYAGKV